MNAQTLSVLLKIRRLSPSALARAIGVSRQAVSLWFHSEDSRRVNVQSRHLERLSQVLAVGMDELTRELPCSRPGPERASLEAALLWDRLYPTLEDFAVAAVKGEGRALARLVQVYGLYAAGRMVGGRIWADFPKYKRHIHPVRSLELERLWQMESNLGRR